jgi:hypothetical protein
MSIALERGGREGYNLVAIRKTKIGDIGPSVGLRA